MIARVHFAVPPCFVGLLAATPAQRPADLAERVAAIEYIDVHDLMYGRDAAAFEELARRWTRDEVRSLVDDADPRVRAIALVVLHEQIGPKAVPVLARFVDDGGQAPPDLDRFSQPVTGLSGDRPARRLRPQTVGGIASTLLSQYLATPLLEQYVGPDRMIGPATLRAATDEYMRTRFLRPHCLVWWRAALSRASGGTMPTAAERVPRIQAVRRELERVPAPERHWYLLSLANNWSQTGREALATLPELLAAARALGPDALLDLLAGIAPADRATADPTVDPDLTAARNGPFGWESLARFVLRHGGELIPADRLPRWLELARLHVEKRSGGIGGGNYGIDSADWYLTAAALDPARAREHFAAGLAAIPRELSVYQSERGRIVLADAARSGDEGRQRAVRWFWSEWPQADFVQALARPEHAGLLWTLLADARLDRLGWGVVLELARACNAHCGPPPPFPDEELRAIQHPIGVRFEQFHPGDPQAPRLIGLGVSIADARARHPDETARLEQTIAGLRARMRELARRGR